MLLLELVGPMANDPDPDTSVSVSTGEVRVGKTFEAERFPVPAVAFEIESLVDDPIRIRLVDRIPDSFGMEGVGFHPDYDSDNWTAYRDHRVAFERTLEPRETVLTVYGIRIDDPSEADAFLDEPSVELIEADETDQGSGDVLGRETTQVVRDALSGEESALSDLGSEPLLGEDADSPAPREPASGLTSAMGGRDASVTTVDADGSDSERAPPDDSNASRTDDDAAVLADPGDDRERAASRSSATGDVGAPAAAPGSVAAALAAEIREGTVDDDDLAVITDAFEDDVPTSVDVRIGRLQSRVEDVLSYRDALADFLDENGTAEELLGDVSEDVAALHDRVDDVDESLSTAATERQTLRDDLAGVSESVDDVGERVGDLETDLERLDDRLDRLDERLTDTEELGGDIEEIQAELDELRTFRNRLSSAFGTDEE
jgi:archaellum component FlaC